MFRAVRLLCVEAGFAFVPWLVAVMLLTGGQVAQNKTSSKTSKKASMKLFDAIDSQACSRHWTLTGNLPIAYPLGNRCEKPLPTVAEPISIFQAGPENHAAETLTYLELDEFEDGLSPDGYAHDLAYIPI